MRESLHCRAVIGQTTARRLGIPVTAVAVPVKNDAAMGGQCFTDGAIDRVRKDQPRLLAGQPPRGDRHQSLRTGTLQFVRQRAQGTRHGGVQHDVRHGDILRGAERPELKLVARESKGEVRLRSVVSRRKVGTEGTPRFMVAAPGRL